MNCSKCGYLNPDSHKFCSECGATLRVCKEEAERRSVTVMFCDLVGSTALSERLDPEDLQQLLTAYQDCCRRAIRHYEGYIARYMGDGLLVYFGYPMAHEDDASRSVRAALKIVEKMPSLSIPPDYQPAVHIGIATGEVVIGDVIGEGTAKERTVLGLTPNLAARLQGIAGENEIVVSKTTLRRLAGTFSARDLGTFSLKGINTPTPAWKIVGLTQSDMGDNSNGPFVGREDALEQLNTTWQEVLINGCKVIHVSGPPGIGKTRLLSEFLAHHGEVEAMQWPCSGFHSKVPLYPVPGYLKTDQEITTASGESKRKILFAAITDQLSHRAKAKSLVLIIEDAHWIDPTTRELLATLPLHLIHLRILIIISSRPCVDTEQLVTSLGGSQLPLQALENEDANTLVQALVDRTVSAEAHNTIIARASGLPLFLEQLAKVVSNDNDADIPDSLQESLLARLDGLGPAKRLAQLASLYGRSFHPAELGLLTEVNASTLEGSLQQLVAAGLVDKNNSGFIFRHALMQELAYQTLLRSTRCRLHGEIADHLRADHLRKANTDPAPELLAHHLSAARRHAEAAPFWCLAAHHSAALWSHQEAASYYLTALEHSVLVADEDWELTTRLDLVDSLRIVDRYDEALQQLEMAEILAKRVGNDVCLLRLHVLRGNILFPLGESDRCIESHQKALAIAERLQDPAAEARAFSSLGDAHFTAGRMASAEHAYDACVQLTATHSLPDIKLANVSIRGHMRLYLCRIEEAETDCRLAVSMAQEAANRRAQMTALGSCLGKVLLEKGLFNEADEVFSQAAALAVDLGAYRFEALNLAFRGKVALARGNRTKALSLGTRAVEIARQSGPRFCLPLALGVVARAQTVPQACREALHEAEILMQDGCVAHNPLWFYRDAGLATVCHGWPELAQGYAQRLRERFAEEPLPWCALIADGLEALAVNMKNNSPSKINEVVQRAQTLGYEGWASILHRIQDAIIHD